MNLIVTCARNLEGEAEEEIIDILNYTCEGKTVPDIVKLLKDTKILRSFIFETSDWFSKIEESLKVKCGLGKKLYFKLQFIPLL